MLGLQELKEIVPIFSMVFYKNEQTIFLSQKNLSFCLMSLKNHLNWQFNVLSCISGVDFLISKYRFSVVYDLLSLLNNSRIRIKIFVNEISIISSIVTIYKNAN
jgi:NADH:ubiquinone oxidoreductase subunit C